MSEVAKTKEEPAKAETVPKTGQTQYKATRIVRNQ